VDTSQAFPPQNLNATRSRYVASVAFSPDGRCLASAHGDVCIWDAATGESLQELKGHKYTGPAQSVAFSPDGHHLASGLYHMVYVWDAATGACLWQRGGHTEGVESVAFSADSCHLASGSWDHTVRVWDTATGVCIKKLRHDDAAPSVAFSLDGHYLVSASTSALTSPFTSAAYAPHNDAIHVWDFAEGSPVIQKRLQSNGHYPPNVSFSADGSVLRVEYPNAPPVQLHFPSLEMIDNPHTSLFYFDKNSLCVKRQGLTLRPCWLPDYFHPTTPVAQHGNHICIGGQHGMIAFVDLDQFALPDL